MPYLRNVDGPTSMTPTKGDKQRQENVLATVDLHTVDSRVRWRLGPVCLGEYLPMPAGLFNSKLSTTALRSDSLAAS